MSSSSMSPKNQLEQEKRLRREIANSNERRRMQSINAGFESLKVLIPHHDGEKLSKAAILMQTTEYIHNLETEKTRLLSQNAQLKGMLREVGRFEPSDGSSPPPKRKKRDTESSDEGISLSVGELDEPSVDEVRREMIELRTQLDRERRLRMLMEEQSRNMEASAYPPERVQQITTNVTARVKIAEPKETIVEPKNEPEPETERSVVSPADGPAPPVNPLMSSMSRRNLETIVEAIRHLEGEAALRDDTSAASNCHIPHSEEESIVEDSTDVEEDDSRSESSMGRYSPTPPVVVERIQPQPAPTMLHLKHEGHIINANTEKYPIAMQLLHQSSQLPQYISRPGVIVQKS